MDGLRDDLEKAFIDDDQEDANNEHINNNENETEAHEDEQQHDELSPSSDENEPIGKKDGQQNRDDKDNEAQTKPSDSNVEKPATVSENEKSSENKPPVSWSPKLREDWSNVPESVQAQIHKREREIEKSLNDGAEHRKLGENFNQIVQPYQALISAEGVTDPMQAVKGLFDTVAVLRTGNAQQKAQRLAQLVNHYGVEIEALDSALSGNTTSSQNSPNSDLEKLVEQKIAPLNQFITQAQQTAKQQMQANIDSEITTFGQGHEFFDDVRNDMANIIDAYTARGEQIDLEKAYNIACQANNEVSSVMAQRQRQDQLLGNNQQIQQKRNASSSITGNKVGSNKSQPASLRDSLQNAWDDNVHNT